MNETIQDVRKLGKPILNKTTSYHLLFSKETDLEECVRYVKRCLWRTSKISNRRIPTGGCTLLYNAMEIAFNTLYKVTKKDNPVLVTTITDGMENSIAEFSGAAINKNVS